jgi:hypothetical protein
MQFACQLMQLHVQWPDIADLASEVVCTLVSPIAYAGNARNQSWHAVLCAGPESVRIVGVQKTAGHRQRKIAPMADAMRLFVRRQ